MQYLQSILKHLQQQACIESLHIYLCTLAQDLNYASCYIHFNPSSRINLLKKDIGNASDQLKYNLQHNNDKLYEVDMDNSCVFKFTAPFENCYGVKINHPFVAYLLIEPNNITTEYQKDAQLLFWQLLLPAIENCLIRITINSRDFQLTKRERECVLWAAANKTSWEISRILNISERTVHFHIQNCLQKSGANNRSHLIQLCKEYNLIH
ncbi:LuxR family transcriptional regulator [uncultured Shewanella sp.]|uniref:helix-turn-helix transcriptional regulator n=1 Tax=uncultured Shewanella sp. TaxID=173975 RepID=UPI0026103321|nr:LuxR family transcriptional regulator [uncultured Shewanella sp.]